jgi:hypothetical protein
MLAARVEVEDVLTAAGLSSWVAACMSVALGTNQSEANCHFVAGKQITLSALQQS